MSPEAQAEFDKVVSAYQEVLKKYPNTEIAAYTGLRLSGLYKYKRNLTKAVEVAKDVSERFAGTEYGTKALLSVGLNYLQSQHNPKEAIKWFRKVPRPTDGVVSPEEYNEAQALYLSAQQQIAKCELALGRSAHADRRYERLAERYPRYKEEIQRTRTRETRIETKRRGGIDPEPLLNERIASDPMFSGETPGSASSALAANESPRAASAVRRDETAATEGSETHPDQNRNGYGFWVGLLLVSLGTGMSVLGILRYFQGRKAGKERS